MYKVLPYCVRCNSVASFCAVTLEWIAGYGRRFGMIYVDFDTQQRTVKASAKEYGEIIKQSKIPK